MIYSLLLILLLLFILYSHSNNEQFNYRRLILLNKKQTSDFLYNDPDKYFENLTQPDILALNATSVNELKNNVIQYVDDFTNEEKDKILQAITIVDNWLLNNKIKYINTIKIANMIWKIAKTKNNGYEQGYPHTRMDIIFITDNVLKGNIKMIAKTLLHEKIHVYQRLYPQDIKEWIYMNGYKPKMKQTEIKLARSNPDVDGIVYEKDGILQYVKYNSSTPSSLDDSRYPKPYDPSSEHPYEGLAYYIDNLFQKDF